MATKVSKQKGVKKVVKKAKVIHGEDVTYTVDVRHIPLNPDMQQALVCEVDDRDSWERLTGMIPSALPRVARVAAKYANGTRCFWCKKPRTPMSEETLFHFHKDYKLCDCLMSLRNKQHEYISGWDTAQGSKDLVDAVMARRLSVESSVYQFTCRRCRQGPVIVRAGTVANNVIKYGKHHRKAVCEVCYLEQFLQQKKATAVPALTAPIQELIGSPKNGPQGKFKKHKNRKGHEGSPQGAAILNANLPPLSAALSDQQLEALDQQALEKVNAAAKAQPT